MVNTSPSIKKDTYETILKQAVALFEGEHSTLANMANLTSLLHFEMKFWWTGFYLVDGAELVLGPFQGPVACTRIGKGKGVCGKAWELNQIVIVDDVETFPGHIACSAESKSEIVVPFNLNEQYRGVLDIDSEKYAHFDEIDRMYLPQFLNLIS